nr:reverse transcriptase domain-containing protein [Tanacetum cinerariifolium]
MAILLTEGYEDAIVVPAITADNFELKHGLFTLAQNKQFFGHDKEDPHAHVLYFNKITSTLKFPNVPNTSIKLMLFPFSLKACDRFKDLLRAWPHHGFLKLHQLDTFYNALNSKDQDSLNSVAGGNFMDKMSSECLAIIESKSKVRYSRDKPVVAKVSTNASTSGISPDVAELVKALLLDKKSQNQSPTPVKAVEESCVTCGGAHSYRNCPATNGNVVENEPEATKDTVNPTNNQSTEDVQPQIFKDMSFEISFADALILMPRFASTLKALIRNKEKSSEMARTPLNEHCSAVLLKKLPEKLGDPGKFLIPCDFPGMAECLALADLGASINLMPFSMWKGLSLPDLTPTCMTLELADHSISRPIGVAEDVYVKVGSFHFPSDFVVVDFDADPRVPLILRRSLLKTGRALIDVFEGELTLRVDKEAITFNLDQTLRYSANYSDMTAKRVDVIDMACEEYSQEVLGVSDTISSGNLTPFYDLIVFTTSSALTPFENSDFLLKEVDAFLVIEDEPTSSEFYQPYLDLEGDILLLEAFLNDDQSLPPLNQRNYLPKVCKELKICEAKSDKSLVDEPSAVELNDLPPHLEYLFLEGDDKLPVIIAKDLSVEEKTGLITVLKSHKRAIAWKLSNIKDAKKISRELILLFLDGFSSYFQIPIDLKDQEKTTFTFPYGTFAYRRMPFGLCNAPGTFQRCMMAIFHDMIKKTMKVFMDDFSVFGNSFQSCLSLLERMLKRCEDTNLCLNWEKSHFMVKEGIVLGHEISKQGIEVEKAKVDVITKLPHPKTVKGIRSFLGHAGFYHRFIKDFSKIARPMTRLLEKDTSFIFSQECVDAFQTLKRKLTEAEAPILIAPDWDMPFELMCDASDFTIGAVLGQHQDKHFKPIHYASKTMTEAESNYTMTEKEMLAVVVLLFNSRLKIFSGKLKSHWSGMFTISQLYPYDTVELSQPDGPNFKVNGHRVKHYFGEDVHNILGNLKTHAERFCPLVFISSASLGNHVKENQEKDKNRIKTGQKREAWRSQEKFNAVAVERGRKTEENKKRMAENAYTYQKLCKFKDKRKDKGLKCYFKKVQPQGPEMQTLQSCGARDDTCN